MAHHPISQVDLNILSLLTGNDLPQPDEHESFPHLRKRIPDRRPFNDGTRDPLMIAAAASAGPDVTRNHYLHEFFPRTLAYASCDEPLIFPPPSRPKMESRQAPRRERLALEKVQLDEQLEPTLSHPNGDISGTSPTSSTTSSRRRLSVSDPETTKLLRQSFSPAFSPSPISQTFFPTQPELIVQCQVRTRIPTPHGHIFLHLYKNNHDDKEHLAFVADQAQMNAHPGEAGPSSLPFLRSQSLDAVWREGETEMERIVRGAYVGKLSASTITPSAPAASPRLDSAGEVEPPLVRIHSECFTGEVIGSQRCDCGEQLDEAFRLITEVGRGVVVYLRQEGRGIGLLEKMRAYNLQDLGHDTVAANLLLGHGADLRTYDIAGAILRDLEVPEVRLLTNNPDKIEQIEKEGISVVERVAMVPRSWTAPPTRKTSNGRRTSRPTLSGVGLLALAEEQLMMSASVMSSSDGENEYEYEEEDDFSEDSDASHNLRRSGVGMIGGSITRSAELDKYLRTKIERMGHMLSLPPTPPVSRADSPALSRERRTRKHLEPVHPLASSIASLLTDEGSVACGSGCEECADSSLADSEGN